MRGFLGEKIGEGAFSDVHAWAPGQVVKLFKAGVPRRLSRHEARVTRAIFTAGGPAPEVLDEVTLEGRFGIVLSRLDGPTLMQLSRSGAMTPAQTGAILASLYMSVHKTPPPTDVLSLRDWLEALQLSGGIVPKYIATDILTLIESLRPGDGLCHADLHPGNVIMTADGPRLVYWTGAVRAPAAFDLTCGHIVLTELAPEFVDDPERPRAYNAAAQSEYARLAGMSQATLTAAMEPTCRSPASPNSSGGGGRPAGAADPAHRSEPALGGLKRSAPSAGIDGAGPSSVSALGLGRVKTQRRANCREKYSFGSPLWEREEHTELRRRDI